MSVTETYDVVVVGLGAMGSATVLHLARRGVRVLGIEKFATGHRMGSAHGESRIIRELYFEDAFYVPILHRAYELWQELEQDVAEHLLYVTGVLMLGPSDGVIVSGARRSAIEYSLEFEDLTADEVNARFPTFRPPQEWSAIWDPRGGYLVPEACMQAQVALAARHGAEFQFGEQVASWEPQGDGVRVITTTSTFHAKKLILTAGAWTGRLVPELHLPLIVERQVQVWFDPAVASPDQYAPEHFPVYIAEHKPRHISYGFPRLARGVKAAIFHEGEPVVNPDHMRRGVEPQDVEQVRAGLARYLPDVARAPTVAAETGLFTNTPDTRFLVDFHPDYPQVLVCSPCSGHGYKFASAIGEVNADLVLTGECRFDLTPFRISRFATAP